MVDILPEDTPLWQSMETAALEVLSSYGYSEIRLPIIEPTDLFARSIGEVTDIVEKEMYTFEDRNGDSLTLLGVREGDSLMLFGGPDITVSEQEDWPSGWAGLPAGLLPGLGQGATLTLGKPTGGES